MEGGWERDEANDGENGKGVGQRCSPSKEIPDRTPWAVEWGYFYDIFVF
jgi:hypothetical protein